jgi:MoxR-like ATPase
MLKKNGPDTMTFGSADVAERAQEVFEPRTNVGGAEKMKQDAQERIRRVLGNPEPPVPSRSPRDAAEHDPSFVMAEETEDIMRTIGAAIRVGYSPNSKGMAGRTIGLYGPPGTGKNAMLQEAAATMGLPYREIDLGEGVDFQAMIGEVVLEADGKGGTRSVAKLGPLGQALVDGEVIALNEIIHTRGDAQTVLNQIAQDGEIQLHATEGARKKTYKVHPSSVLALTWNPKGGKQNRPIESLSSRIFSSRRVDYPTPEEESRRLHSWAEGMGLPNVDEESTRRTVDMLHDLRELYIQRGIEAPPTFRAGQSFLSIWKMTNDINQGVEQLRIFTNQLEDHDMQWRDVTNLVDRHFGHLMD